MGEVIELREALDRMAHRVPVEDRLTEIVSHTPEPATGTDTDRQQGAVDIDAPRRSAEERVTMIQLSPDKAPPPNAPTSGLRRPILIAAAAVVLVVGAIVVSGGGDSEIDVPAAPPSTVSSTTVDTASTPIEQPIGCESEQCPWSPELTAHTLQPPITCTGSTFRSTNSCANMAVSPDGTLVAYDTRAKTLTWHEDVPRVVAVTAELPGASFELEEIGPHDIAYIATEEYLVAVAPSGAEITRVDWTNRQGPLHPTDTGLASSCCPNGLAMPWVDLDGNPITDTRPYPTANDTDTGIEVRLGERQWLLAGEAGVGASFPRSDGGLVVLTFNENDPVLTVLELSPDGTIERYFVEWLAAVLPDGSLIVQHNLQLIRLTPPA